ncbi:hypothetical protein [Methylobacterium sp. Leaf125]|uniref:TRADD-N-associated membrane domain-containing protein n=1 Tax=Methylobacterium sp. Leaf125 TaxID=1736265 RepID=UPI000ACF3BFE|nr:hypothetical protein [Methylobacterium sp. Leaf125]
MSTLFENIIVNVIRAWKTGGIGIRSTIIFSVIFGVVAGIIALLYNFKFIPREFFLYTAFFPALVSFGLLAVAVGFGEYKADEQRKARIEHAEEVARENPEKPQLAWDVARAKLENYLDRNLGQLRSIFWLTIVVMAVGFGMIIFGIFKAYDPSLNLSVSIIAAVSGLIVSFIGGSFLIVYRYILEQAKSYVTVLERINAVGMAVQVLGSISEEDKQLKNKATADLAKQLIQLYAVDQNRLSQRSGRLDRKAN